ncbi:MAG: phosphorylase family protein [Chloroflexota bacterium]
MATIFEALPLLGLQPRVVGIGGRRRERGWRAFGCCSALISAGFAGACQPGLAAGEVILTGDVPAGLAEALGASGGVLRTVGGVASPREKRRLGEEGATAVDMETAWLASAAAQRHVPFLAVRVIIDRAQDRAAGLSSARHYPLASMRLRQAVRRVLERWP